MKTLSIVSKIFLILLIAFLLFFATKIVSAHLARIVYNQGGDIKITNPEVSQAFYDQLGGDKREYLLSSDKDFDLYVNLLVPAVSNPFGRYSANIYFIKDGKEEKIEFLDGQTSFQWQEFYEPFSRDYYYKGPEFEKQVLAGDYRIEVFSYENRGKYVLAVGKEEKFSVSDILSVYWLLPKLKMEFFQTPVLEFLFTPFGLALAGILVVILLLTAFINFIKFIIEEIKSIRPRVLLLTSAGMQVFDEIENVLLKPIDKTRLAYVTTASNSEEDKRYVNAERELMKQVGFNVEDLDIEGKDEKRLMYLLKSMDVIYVQGGNTFYLLKCIRESGFDKVVKKLIKKGVAYIGVSAGSMVAGRTIETALWKNGDKNHVNLQDLRGMNLIPYNIFAHYTNEYEDLIKSKKRRERRRLKILTDDQALLVVKRKIVLVGQGEEIKFK